MSLKEAAVASGRSISALKSGDPSGNQNLRKILQQSERNDYDPGTRRYLVSCATPVRRLRPPVQRAFSGSVWPVLSWR